MSSIPAPNIAELGGQIARAPLAEYGRAVEIQGAQQEQQARAQQMEMQRRQLADQDALTKAMTQYDPAKHSLSEIPQLVTKNGGSGEAALKLQSGLVQQRRNLAALSDEDFAHQQKISDLTQGVHDEVSQAPADQKQQTYSRGLMQLAQNGVDISKESPAYPGDEVFKQHLVPIRLHSALLSEAEKDREVSVKEQEQKVKQQEANTKEQEEANKEWIHFPELGVALNTQTGEQKTVAGAGGVMSPAMRDSKYLAIQEKKNAKQPISSDDAAWSKAYEKMKTLVPVANFSMQNSGTGTVAQPSAMAQAIASGQMKWGDVISARTPQSIKENLLKEIKAINPAFNSGDFAIEQGVRKDFTSGPDAQKLQAFNTAITHMGIFQQMADKLDNNDVQFLNKVGNVLGTQFGSDKATNFNIAKQAFIGEVSRAFDGAGVTMHDREAVDQQIGSAGSPAQLKGAAQTAEKLLRGKRDVLQQQYEAGKQGKPNFGDQQAPAGGSDFFSQFGGKKR